MTYAPKTLQDLAAYWTSEGGVNLGIVGDTDHATKGVSYHLGRDQLKPGAYSATRPRDKAGLTNAASAIDLGRLDGSLPQLRAFSDWLARRCLKQPDIHTRDVVEVIYSPDGRRVLGYKDGIDFLIPDYGDASHLTHTHISFFRDSESREKLSLFEPYFLPETSTEVDVDLNYGAERWMLDGTTPVTSIGAPRLADGSSDPNTRYVLTTGKGGTPWLITPIARSRLDPVASNLSDDFWNALTGYRLPAGDEKHPVEISVDGRIVYSGAI